MATKKSQLPFTEEYKVETVKQVTEKSFAVADVVVPLLDGCASPELSRVK